MRLLPTPLNAASGAGSLDANARIVYSASAPCWLLGNEIEAIEIAIATARLRPFKSA